MLGVFLLCFVWGTKQAEAQFQKNYGESCASDTDCIAGLQCVGETGKQLCLHSCNLQTNLCPNGEKCTLAANGQGACLCQSDDDCDGVRRCTDGRCGGLQGWGEECDTTQSFCQAGFTCVQRSGDTKTRCWPICTGSLCADGSACTRTGDFSICTCQSNADCKSTYCVDGRCLPGRTLGEECIKDTLPCENNLSCVPLTTTQSICAPACTNNCISGLRCQSLNDGQRACVCSQSNPCPGALTCVQGICDVGPRCLQDSDCSVLELCVKPVAGVDQGFCTAQCQENKDCKGNTPCARLTDGRRGCFCTKNTDCQTGEQCIAFSCIPSCSQSTECPVGQECRKGACQPPIQQEPSTGEPNGSEKSEEKPKPTEKPATTDAGTPETSGCDPACQTPLRCVNGTCSKLDFGDTCTQNDECTSGFCFGIATLKVCSSKDCTRCGGINMTCQTLEGQQGCYLGRTNPEDPPVPKACGCQSLEMTPSWLLLFFFWFAWFSTRLLQRRRTSSHPPHESAFARRANT